MKRPINVYLDTQDYINLGKSTLTSEMEAIKAYLLEEIRIGSVVIGYSYPLIFELLRNSDEKHRVDRQSRARTIKQLCGSHAHPYPTDLKDGRTFPNKGIWVPISTFDGITPSFVKAKFAEPIDNLIADPRLTRQKRQQLKSTKGVRELFRSVRIGPFSKADFTGMPVPEQMLKDRIVERYLRGDLSVHSIINALRGWMIDPENMMELWYEYSGFANPLEAIVSKTAAPLFDALEQMRQLQVNYKKLVATQKKNQRELRSLIAKTGLDAGTLGVANLLTPPPKLEVDFPKKKFDELFGEGRGDVIELYVNSVVFGEHESQDSDVIDMLHFLYIPDVDLFRCDRKMAHLVGREPSAFRNKIVSSLLDLPARIDALKTARQSKK
ncbi:hypothetical protein IHQ71_13100 [Rhizobium sp. TH2]|uniref:hypothetical protein n=1 Tax=Rhizobium sp. TH2 TaxID=2775403 RepID=UPI002157AE26|nr:hypothetical protein [Rhizobium sp. TH2]UVC11424.1 hypothetical protein IHQ71_13100 [Rhizobium sp. TH2]